MTSEKPSSAIRSSDSGGVRPPSAQLNTSGATPAQLGRHPRDVLLATSAPRRTAGRRRPRRTPGPGRSRRRAPATATASVRAMITRSGSVPRLDGGPELADHLVGADQRLAAHVPALLGHHLVLELDPGDAGLLVQLHRADDVDRVAVAGVGVGDHRHVDGGDDPAGVVDHLARPRAARRRGGRSARPSSRSRSCRRRRSRPARSAGRERASYAPGAISGVPADNSSRRRARGARPVLSRSATTASSLYAVTRNLRPNGWTRGTASSLGLHTIFRGV